MKPQAAHKSGRRILFLTTSGPNKVKRLHRSNDPWSLDEVAMGPVPKPGKAKAQWVANVFIVYIYGNALTLQHLRVSWTLYDDNTDIFGNLSRFWEQIERHDNSNS